MKAVRTFILLVLFLLCAGASAWAAVADGDSTAETVDLRGESNVTFAQRTDGSKLVDVYYTLNGGTSSVALGVSLDGGTTFSSVTTLTGDVGAAVSAGTAKQIVWNAGTDQPNAGYPNVRMRVTAFLDGAGGTFAPIPGGTYQMGNLIGDSNITNAGTVTVTLSPYYMGVNDVTKAQWDSVRTWASANGYTDLAVGAGKAANHPVQTVKWYDVVKWANAASEKEGLTPCYQVSGSVVRTGTSDSVTCDWSANGYRLPTEAEWEVAARGGLSGKRFPWGDTILQSQANYKASPSHAYGSSGSVNDNHPTYKTGGTPYTSPVGSFAANVYGLYDMAGNVRQWCWDWYGTPYGGGTDPRGAATGSRRVFRGGSWWDQANIARSAYRNYYTPSYAGNSYGFRLARGRPSGSGTGTLSGGGVVDTTPPVVTVPGAVSVSATSASGASVTLSGASATDNRGGTPSLTYSPASGSTFPVGTTTVTVTASDSMGNTASGTYSVTVSPVAVAPEATGVTFSQRTDGSKLVDVFYTLTGGTSSVALGVSLDGGTTFSSVTTLTGDVGAAVSAGTAKQIVWNAGTDQPGAGYPNVKMRVTALLDGAGGTFAPIPGGTYQMGNLIGDSNITNAGTVTVTLSPYYKGLTTSQKRSGMWCGRGRLPTGTRTWQRVGGRRPTIRCRRSNGTTW